MYSYHLVISELHFPAFFSTFVPVKNKMKMNESSSGQQELNTEPRKKTRTYKIVKRALSVTGLVLVIYFAYSIIHLFVSPDRNI